MAAIDFRDIAQLVNLTKTTQIETTSDTGRDGRWALYRAKHVVHRAEYPFNVIYFYAAASAEDVRFALSETRSVGERHIVFAPSAYQRLIANDEVERLARKAGRVWTTREYLISFVDVEVEAYVAKIAEQAPRDYIDPRIETPVGTPAKTPNPVLSFLTDPMPENAAGQLGIVLAEPGQGKTYMTKFLVSRLAVDADRHLVPLMVDSSQWHSMSLEEQRSLEKTIAHSFRHFGAPIGWLEGHESEFLRLTLKTDVLRIVFDGFDEYILRNGGAVQPLDVLEALAELAEATSARIVITSRTSFWEAIYNDDIAAFVTNRKPLIFHIQPFDLEHAKNYFIKKLSPAQAEKATSIYASLRAVSPELVGRGFVLSLVADVATEPSSSTAVGELRNPILWITKALCRREQLRQSLPLTADDQLRAFRTFAAELTEQPVTSTLLEIAIGEVREMLDPATLTETVRKLRSHPLLVYDAAGDRWEFKQHQILLFFLAEQIIAWRDDQVANFLVKAHMPAEEWQDLGTMIVDIVVKRMSWDDALARLQGLIKAMSRREYSPWRGSPATEDGGRLGSIIALMTVEKLLDRGSAHSDRAELLVKLTGPDVVRDLHFSGIIARYDFRGTTFRNCLFEQLTWANCQFDGSTEFIECEFIGGAPPRYTQGLGLVRLTRSRRDPIAEAIFNSERIRAGEKKYSRDDLRSDLHSVLGRFISRGGIALKTVAASTLTRGPFSNSRYRDEIIEVLESTVLERHHISGTSGGYHVRKEAEEAVKFYASNNVFTGPLRELWEKLREKLSL